MATQKPHVVCLPTPLQGHINPMMQLAKLLHSKGFYITMVLTEFDAAKLAANSSSLQGLHDFSVETIPDGLPADNMRGVLDLPGLCRGLVSGVPAEGLRGVLEKIECSPDIPKVKSMIIDTFMFFAHEVANEMGISWVTLFTSGAAVMIAFMQYDELVNRGHFSLKDESCLTNGYLDTPADWVPGLIKGTKLKHLPTFIRTTDPNDTLFNFTAEAGRRFLATKALILNTFDDLELKALEAIKPMNIPNLFTISPFLMLSQQPSDHQILPFQSSLWKEDLGCLEWLDKRSPKSVIYVNYGSLAILTPKQLEEFAWGLANSNHPFLWVIRSNLVEGELSNILSRDYMEEIKDRGFISSWCPQQKVLKHPSVAAFLTHGGWNSILESMSAEMPMICWSFFADQQLNCLYVCQEWKIGVEMEEGDVRKEKVEELVKEMMEGEKGKEARRNVGEWNRKAMEATRYGGSSHSNFEKLVKYLIS
ncbi:unnamed protein product [Amaranthus hypochondriacus]